MVVKLGNWSLGIGSEMGDVNRKPLALIILDGWGYSSSRKGNAIALAHTPNYDFICENFPSTILAASGERVGLTNGAAGDSEIGHLAIGTGQLVKGPENNISDAIADGSFYSNEALNAAYDSANARGSSIHLVGLISDGGVHSSLDSLFALLRLAAKKGIRENVYIHAILDGKDVPQRTADVYLELLGIKLAEFGIGQVASVCGRHYAMDSSNNWDRTVRAFTMLVHAEGEPATDPIEAVRGSFLRGISDEFIQPVVIQGEDGSPVARIKDGDTVVFFNHRPDGLRQLTRAIAVSDFGENAFGKPKISAVCLTEYDEKFELPVAFKLSNEARGLARVFAENGIYNYRVSEAEKFAYVTQFFNGGSEAKHPCEQRVAIPSRLDLALEAPEMGSFKVADRLLRGLEEGENEVFIANLSAADLVAHTGNLEKTVEAVQFVDTCLGGIIAKITELGGTAIITADHGNVEQMIDPRSGRPDPDHTANPVPFHIVSGASSNGHLREDGALEDIAPTMLAILGIEKPAEMTGRDLRLS
ncbi:MAG: 2,3-bisphosphoglycerate-independent phosphoglycerate mutase [Acidobacteria bacterium]|nr:MAG: 2,3-bisphosphoglycerate-independent phosphoglycerate mutase [Acidobacteriota bacterium]REK04029.1 MAG: 2,3-bisphosphoglycerate-independent phosphoglycerate mutase [Acidobacteriota bacterium]REK15191.1 MAG: 2,3-bisphosphoglycerate-independent phosphoglycerate mutase [Acidobacteriota bacterium]REK46281.1 MAG: 2,3-bisphosphoglycerate-independent phosphoglycerate mutase [Acidobacteriota bacterium]